MIAQPPPYQHHKVFYTYPKPQSNPILWDPYPLLLDGSCNMNFVLNSLSCPCHKSCYKTLSHPKHITIPSSCITTVQHPSEMVFLSHDGAYTTHVPHPCLHSTVGILMAEFVPDFLISSCHF